MCLPDHADLTLLVHLSLRPKVLFGVIQPWDELDAIIASKGVTEKGALEEVSPPGPLQMRVAVLALTFTSHSLHVSSGALERILRLSWINPGSLLTVSHHQPSRDSVPE